MARTILTGLRQTVASFPNREAVVCGSTRYTFDEVAGRINRLSTGLARIGLAKGDRVAILALH